MASLAGPGGQRVLYLCVLSWPGRLARSHFAIVLVHDPALL